MGIVSDASVWKGLTNDAYRRLLSRHPDVLAKLREEIQGQVGSNLPTQQDLKRMPYLSFVLKEGTSPLELIAPDLF